jgi:hypothetical protein
MAYTSLFSVFLVYYLVRHAVTLRRSIRDWGHGFWVHRVDKFGRRSAARDHEWKRGCVFLQFLQGPGFSCKTLVYVNVFQRTTVWCTQPAYTYMRTNIFSNPARRWQTSAASRSHGLTPHRHRTSRTKSTPYTYTYTGIEHRHT